MCSLLSHVRQPRRLLGSQLAPSSALRTSALDCALHSQEISEPGRLYDYRPHARVTTHIHKLMTLNHPFLRNVRAKLQPTVSRRGAARLLSTLICSICIVVRPFSKFGGPYAFLLLSLKELVFSAQEDLAMQLEITVLNILGALSGIGLSALSRYFTSLLSHNTAAARAIPAVFLVFIAFLSKTREFLDARLS